MAETLSSAPISPRLERIAELARNRPGQALTALAHHLDLAWMVEAYRRTRKDGAPGIDGQTASQYAQNLEGNLRSLLDRAKAGTYRAPPVRRVHLPKGDGAATRPIGIPTFEDKVLQRAVTMVLQAVYEQDFLPCSYGFRPGRSAHDALETVQNRATVGGWWVVEVDIASFFDTIDRALLLEILRQRVRDGVLLRLIGKWLRAGVFEAGAVTHPEAGTPQGGVVSPLLANVYLHEVLDRWFAEQVRPRLGGRADLVRYADDVLLLFGRAEDARRVLAVLPKRLGRYGLTLHPDKTRLVDFRRPDRAPPRARGDGSRRSFDLLGFTHYWAHSRTGKWVVKRKTAKGRFARALKRVAAWCRRHRHDDLRSQWQGLVAKLHGHYGYYGITWNYEALARFRFRTGGVWRRWLSRRSQRARLSKERTARLFERYPLPPPRIVHSMVRPKA